MAGGHEGTPPLLALEPRSLRNGGQWLTTNSSSQGSRDHKMEQYVCTPAHLRSIPVHAAGRFAAANKERGKWVGTTRAGLTTPRHGGQPPQVLPLDEAYRVPDHNVRCRCPCDTGLLRIYHRGEWGGWMHRSEACTNAGQGKWDFRGKRRGDTVSEF